MDGTHPEHNFPARNRPPPSETSHAVEAEPIEKKAQATRAFYPPGLRLSQSEFIAERLHPRSAAGLDQLDVATGHLTESAHRRRTYWPEKPPVLVWYWARFLAHPLIEAEDFWLVRLAQDGAQRGTMFCQLCDELLVADEVHRARVLLIALERVVGDKIHRYGQRYLAPAAIERATGSPPDPSALTESLSHRYRPGV